jgi:HlyD family secretion protein
MEVWTSVNEADIGRIKLNMPAWFTVDAHEDEVFHGTVTQIRMNAQMTQNVVTFTVVVTTDNSSGKLLPYLTANVYFEIEKREQVLLVPNVALRWLPGASQLDPSVSKSVLDETVSRAEGKGRIWIDTGGRVKPLEVIVGATDGSVTEVSGDALTEGLLVVIGEEDVSNAAADEGTRNPFLPKFPRRPPPPR